MFITPAYAQAAGGAGSTDLILQFAPLLFIFVIMYIMLIRPQQKREGRTRDRQPEARHVHR